MLRPPINLRDLPRRHSSVNCWEYRQCGREPGGVRVRELGVCPAATYVLADGFLGGRLGGRACAYVFGRFCTGTLPGTRPSAGGACSDCTLCDFYARLRREHGADCSVLELSRHVRAQVDLDRGGPDEVRREARVRDGGAGGAGDAPGRVPGVRD